jgi:hypothetical protein
MRQVSRIGNGDRSELLTVFALKHVALELDLSLEVLPVPMTTRPHNLNSCGKEGPLLG